MAQDCVATLECTIAWSEHHQEPEPPAQLLCSGLAVPWQGLGKAHELGQTRKDP